MKVFLSLFSVSIGSVFFYAGLVEGVTQGAVLLAIGVCALTAGATLAYWQKRSPSTESKR